MGLARIGKGIRYLAILNLIQILAILIFYHILTNTLTQAEIGLSATLTFVYTVLTSFSPLALPLAGAKFIAEFLGRREEEKAAATARSIVRLVLISSTITALLFHLILVIVASRTGFSDVLSFSFISIAAVIASLKLTYLSFIQGLQLFDRLSITNLSTTIVSYIVGIILTPNFRVLGFAMGIIVGDCIGLMLAIVFHYGYLPKTTSFHNSRELLRLSFPVYIMQIVTIISDWADRILFLAASLNFALLGVYDLAVKSAASLLIISHYFETIIIPILASSYGNSGNQGMSAILQKGVRWLGVIYFPVAFGLAAISNTVMIVLYGSTYAEGGILLALLAVSSIFTAFYVLLGAALKSIGKTRAFIKISLVSLVVDAVLVIYLTPPFGLLGPSIGRISAAILALILIYNEVRRFIEVEVDWSGFWKSLFASIISAATLIVIDNLSIDAILVKLSVGIGVGVLSYITALMLLKTLQSEDFHMLRQITPMLIRVIDFIQRISGVRD
ncbi:MAG: polysaccharide biosynthesis C-terminal domain-containing protein [Candidatus Bathyarchaeota archaeon]|nr:MAG: polysaccharide biosynthesis C-terminal domain-containing protein [Candidatus Bathyarchaeota archaeon]